jgi:hypothetical protein
MFSWKCLRLLYGTRYTWSIGGMHYCWDLVIPQSNVCELMHHDFCLDLLGDNFDFYLSCFNFLCLCVCNS